MNNKKNAVIITRFFEITWIISLIILVVSLLWNIGLGSISQIALIIFLLLVAATFHSGGFYYTEFELEKTEFRLKHYNLFPFGQQYKVFKIQHNRFSKYEIKRYAGGIFSWLYIYEQTGRGLAKYPAIGISALSSAQIKSLVEYLNNIKPTK